MMDRDIPERGAEALEGRMAMAREIRLLVAGGGPAYTIRSRCSGFVCVRIFAVYEMILDLVHGRAAVTDVG